jgi:hypothetical protein
MLQQVKYGTQTSQESLLRPPPLPAISSSTGSAFYPSRLEPPLLSRKTITFHPCSWNQRGSVGASGTRPATQAKALKASLSSESQDTAVSQDLHAQPQWGQHLLKQKTYGLRFNIQPEFQNIIQKKKTSCHTRYKKKLELKLKRESKCQHGDGWAVGIIWEEFQKVGKHNFQLLIKTKKEHQAAHACNPSSPR